MMVEQAPLETDALHWLPAPSEAPRELDAPVDGIPAVLDWLADERFDGLMVVASGPHELAAVLLEGVVHGAHLRSTVGMHSLEGPAALRGLIQRAGPAANTRTRVLSLERPLVECLTAVLDPQPRTRALDGTNELRDTLRDLAAQAHHGVVDLVVGERWGRALFYRGRLVGAYDTEHPAIAASLAGLGQLAQSGAGRICVRTTPAGPLPRLEWPTLAVLAAQPAEPPPAPPDDERDERIETNFLWLLSHVDRDCDRAGRATDPQARVLQVLASFVNAVFSFASHLGPGAGGHREPPRLATAVAAAHAEHPILDELELNGDEIDASALAARYRSLPRGGDFGAEFYVGMTHALLALVQQAAGAVIREVAQPIVRQRCAVALETWMGSVEAALPRTGKRDD